VCGSVGLGWWLGTDVFRGSPDRQLPVELVYLDAARVNAYLGQLERGLAASEKQDLSKTASGNASVTAGGAVSVGGSVSSTESIERTVTPDEGDRFLELLGQVRGTSHLAQVDLHTDSSASDEIQGVSEGDFIEIQNARLVVPRFALAVPALSLAGGYGTTSSSDLTTLIATYPSEIQGYLKSFGPNPTFPLTVRSSPRQDTIRVPIILSAPVRK